MQSCSCIPFDLERRTVAWQFIAGSYNGWSDRKTTTTLV